MLKDELDLYKKEAMEALLDLKTKGQRKNQIPNILTSLRLLAPFVILPVAFLGNISLLVGSVAVFSLTDFADGFIARKFHLTSELGKDLDAFCDKLFSATLLVATSFFKPVMLLTLFLETAISCINVKAKIKGFHPHSLYIGKAKTVFLFPLLGISLLSTKISLGKVFYPMLTVTSVLQILTMIGYQKEYRKIANLKKENLNENPKEYVADEDDEVSELKVKELENQFSSFVIEEESSKTSEDLKTLKEMRELLLKETIVDVVEEKKKINEI